MKRVLLTMTLGILASFLVCGVALAEEKLDQQNTDPWQSSYHYKEFNSDFEHLAQVFTAGKTGELSKVSVRISKGGCGPCKDITVRIYASGPSSSQYAIASTTIPATQVPSMDSTYWYTLPWTEVTFDPGNRPRVYAGTQYAIALEPEPVPFGSAEQPSYRWYYNSYEHYTGGDSYVRRIDYSGTRWEQRWSLDFLFKTHVDVPDSDGDGIANDVDRCDYESGPASNNGCPIPPDTVKPTGSVVINGGKLRTTTCAVTLRLNATDPAPGSGVASMRLKNAGGDWTAWRSYTTRKDWTLTRGAGKKTVYVQYKDGAGNVSARASDSITYRP